MKLLTSNLSLNDWKISCVMDNNGLMQQSPGLNPNWFDETSLFSSIIVGKITQNICIELTVKVLH